MEAAILLSSNYLRSQNAFIIAKATHPTLMKDKWECIQDFIEDLSMDLTGTWRGQKSAPLTPATLSPTLKHDIVSMFEKFRTCPLAVSAYP